MASQDEFELASQNFQVWLEKMGIKVSPKMQLADLRSESRGRGAIASGDFAEDEVIFSIPRQSVLNIKTASNTPSITALGLDLPSLPTWLALTAIILSESRQADSKWSPYFGVLPNHLDSLVFWSESELQELQASTVVKKIGKSGAEEMFAQYLTPLGFQNDLCHRVASTIMAYAFDIPEEETTKPAKDGGDDELESDDEEDEKTILSMVPLADMLNADADKNNARLFYDAEDLEMRAIKPISKGEEIFNDYGQLPSADLLRRYGYVTDNYAPFDVAEISTQTIIDAFSGTSLQDLDSSLLPLTQPQLKRRLEIADREDIYEEESFDLYHPSSEQTAISDEFLAFVFLLLASKETFDALHSSHIAIPNRLKLTTELVGKVIVKLLKAGEAEYSSTLEEDEVMLQNQDLPYRTKLAIKVRLGEKKVIRDAILEAETFQRNNQQMRIAQEEEAPPEKGNGKRKAEHRAPQSRKKGRN